MLKLKIGLNVRLIQPDCLFLPAPHGSAGPIEAFEGRRHGERVRQLRLWCDVCTVAPKRDATWLETTVEVQAAQPEALGTDKAEDASCL